MQSSDNPLNSLLTFAGVLLTLIVSIYLAMRKEKRDSDNDTLTRAELIALEQKNNPVSTIGDDVLFQAFQELQRQNDKLLRENTQLKVLLIQLRTQIAQSKDMVELKTDTSLEDKEIQQ